jgi:hypothetical protein
MSEVELLTEIFNLLKVIGIFVIGNFGWKLYRAFCGGWFRLDK